MQEVERNASTAIHALSFAPFGLLGKRTAAPTEPTVTGMRACNDGAFEFGVSRVSSSEVEAMTRSRQQGGGGPDRPAIWGMCVPQLHKHWPRESATFYNKSAEQARLAHTYTHDCTCVVGLDDVHPSCHSCHLSSPHASWTLEAGSQLRRSSRLGQMS